MLASWDAVDLIDVHLRVHEFVNQDYGGLGNLLGQGADESEVDDDGGAVFLDGEKRGGAGGNAAHAAMDDDDAEAMPHIEIGIEPMFLLLNTSIINFWEHMETNFLYIFQNA